MQNTKNQRIKILIRWLISQGVANSQEDLGKKIGINNKSYVSQLVNCKVENADFINKLSKLNERINPQWLMTGEGEMLKPSQNIGSISDSTVVGANVSGNGNKITNNDVSGLIELQKGYQELLKERDKILQANQEHLSKSQEQIDRLIGIIEHSKK